MSKPYGFCLAALTCVAVGIGATEGLLAETLVVREGFDQPKEWQRKPFLGRDFFPLLAGVYWAAPGCRNIPEGYSVYRESGLRIGLPTLGVNDLVRVPGGMQNGYAQLVPINRRRTEPYRLYDFWKRNNGDRAQADHLYGTSWIDRPFLLTANEDRPSFMLNKKYPYADRADFAQFKASHPNYMGNYAMMEFDSDLSFYFINFEKTQDGEALKRLQAAYPCTFWNYACNTDFFDTWIDEAKRRSVEFYFGEDNQWAFSSGCPGIVPLFAKAGCKGVCYEATTQTSSGSWRFAGAYLRGAARQFGMSCGWYTANFYDGYVRGGKRKISGENSLNGPVKGYGAFGLNRGASFEIIDRQNAYGWLIGARFSEPENWYHYQMETKVEKVDGAEKRFQVPSRAARHMEDLYRLSKRQDRGLAYAPLALLFPIHEKVGADGGQMYFTGFRQSAPLLTLVPACPIPDFRRQGIEGNFFNSEFGEIFDIVCPDATNDLERTVAAMRPYKAAALFGRFRLAPATAGAAAGKGAVLPKALTRYAEEGGTLFVSEEYVREGIVEASAAGIAFPGREILAAGKTLVDDRGAAHPLKEPYVLKVGRPTTAQVFWKDEKGQPIAYLNRVGKGKVVTVAVDGMLPDGGWTQSWGIPDPSRHTEEFGKIYRGEVTFEIMRTIFLRVQEETMPFQVAGDIHWGVNKIEVKGKGEGEGGRKWLVWFFNNKGVTNFIGEAPVVDHRADAKVTVKGALGVKIASVRDVRASADALEYVPPKANTLEIDKADNSFEVTVPAGGWLAFEVVER